MEHITSKQIPEHERLGFLPRKLGGNCVNFEHLVFNFMGQFCADYSGGYWQFYELSNEGFYIALDTEEQFSVINPDNYFYDEMSAEAASIAINLYAINTLCWKTEKESFSNFYYNLRDFASQHKEVNKFFALID